MESFEVCSTSDLKDGELKDFQLNDDIKILLLHKDGKFYASGTKCTHYGAPLIKGSLCGTKVRCPWHGANFDIVTGDIEDYPGCDSIASYKTEVKGDKVHVTLDPAVAKDGKRPLNLAAYNPAQDKRTFVVIGGGAAGYIALQTIRENGFQGKLVLVSQERHLPYDRVKLSKTPDVDPAKIALRGPEFYKNASVELKMETTVTKLDAAAKTITLSDKSTINYDALLVATGGRPRMIPGLKAVKGVHVLRSPEDGKSLVEESKGKNVVIVGAGFIGIELAAALVKQASSVHLVGRDAVPLSNVFGEKIGRLLLKMHETNGVKYLSGVTAKEFVTSKDGAISGVILTNGEQLAADVCLVAAGVEPATEFLRESEVKLDPLGYVDVDEHMRTNVNGIYAAGDIAFFPLPLTVTGGTPRRSRIGHWGIAQQMGRVAALNMVGKEATIDSVPFFFTMLYGKGIRFGGDTTGGFGDVVIHGDMDAFKWVAYFVEKGGDRVVAVSTMGMDPVASHFAQLMGSGRQLTRAEIETDTEASWVSKLCTV